MPQPRRLISAEEEYPVAGKRSAGCSTPLVSVQSIVSFSSIGTDRGEILRRVEPAIPDEFEAEDIVGLDLN